MIKVKSIFQSHGILEYSDRPSVTRNDMVLGIAELVDRYTTGQFDDRIYPGDYDGDDSDDEYTEDSHFEVPFDDLDANMATYYQDSRRVANLAFKSPNIAIEPLPLNDGSESDQTSEAIAEE